MTDRFPRTIDFQVNQTKYNFVWPVNDEETLRVIMDEWAANLPKILARVKKTGTVVQAGGHCGVYPYLYSEHFQRVFTFEPELSNFAHLAVNCNDTRIVKFHAALSDRNDFVSMAMVSYINTGMNKVLPRGIHGLIAYGITLDSVKVPECDLIHLDVEGHEYEALKGAAKTIKKFKPLIVTELSHKKEKIIALLDKYGYKEVESLDGNSTNSIFEYSK